MTMGELARLFNARKQDRRGAHRDPHGGLAPRRLVRFHRPAVGQPFAQHAQPERGDAVSGPVPAGILAELSVGRGTDAPFEQIGADFIGGRELAAYLNQRQIPGVRVYPTSFTPTESNFKGVRIEGVRFEITNRETVRFHAPGPGTGRGAIQKLYPGQDRFRAEPTPDRQRRRDPAPASRRGSAHDSRELPGRAGRLRQAARAVPALSIRGHVGQTIVVRGLPTATTTSPPAPETPAGAPIPPSSLLEIPARRRTPAPGMRPCRSASATSPRASSHNRVNSPR